MCDRCGAALDAASRIDGLVQLQNVSLRLTQRITCDEEERQRFGYDLVTAWRFPEVDGRLDRRDAEVVCDGVPVLGLSYGDAADLWRVNLGWTHQDEHQPRGFNRDLHRRSTARLAPPDPGGRRHHRDLIGMGYIVIRFHHQDDWLAIFRRHADVFGAVGQ